MPPGNQIESPDGRLQFERKRCRELLSGTCIIAQTIKRKVLKNLSRRLCSALCRFARSVVAFVDDFSDHALAAAGHLGLGLVPAWVRRDGPLGGRTGGLTLMACNHSSTRFTRD